MAKSKAYWNRTLHRDLGYFFLGLIITFSISGITLNHRKSFSSREYVIETKDVEVKLPTTPEQLNETFVKRISEEWGLSEAFRGFRNEGDELVIFYKDAFAMINAKTGRGSLEFSRTIPVLGQMTILHQTTNTWWIWFSDIFGIAMLIIAITGMFMSKGKFSFKRRGWILMAIGLIFPLLFLFLIR